MNSNGIVIATCIDYEYTLDSRISFRASTLAPPPRWRSEIFLATHALAANPAAVQPCSRDSGSWARADGDHSNMTWCSRDDMDHG